jgi:hypothetical protein
LVHVGIIQSALYMEFKPSFIDSQNCKIYWYITSTATEITLVTEPFLQRLTMFKGNYFLYLRSVISVVRLALDNLYLR